MFHITPTPTSWMLWAAIYVVAVLVIAGLAFLSISFDKTGEKISVYIGDNNTVIVSDTGIKGEKK